MVLIMPLSRPQCTQYSISLSTDCGRQSYATLAWRITVGGAWQV